MPTTIVPFDNRVTRFPNDPNTRFVVVIVLLLTASCGADTLPTTTSEVIWRPVGAWSGHGNTQTGSFSVETGALRVRWETGNENPPGTGTFRVSLHSAVSGRPLQIAVDHRGVGRDTTYIEDDPRVSYLVVESANIDWTLNLEEAVPGTVEPRRN